MPKLTEEQIAQIPILRRAHYPWSTIGRILSCTPDTARRHCDPEYGDHRRALINMARRTREHRAGPRVIPYAVPVVVPPDVLADRERRAQAQNLKTLTASLMGDPEPGRFSWDNRMQPR